MKFINIYSKGSYPADVLSNFFPCPFTFEGKEISCMEALLQSLKFSDISQQEGMLCLDGRQAKLIGSEQRWERHLYWQGRRLDRFSSEYRRFLERAYRELTKNETFRKALADSKGSILLHTIGRCRRKSTVLTWWEFVMILMKLRREI